MNSSRRSKGGLSSSSSSSSSSAAAAAANAESERRSRELRAFQQDDAANKACVDCGQRGPTYVNMTVGAFVCTKCSGMLRGINPPHRIKSLSMSSFTADEVAFVKARGNTWAKKVYLGLYDESRAVYDLKDNESVKDFIIEKYEKKRYYVDPSTIVHTPQTNNAVSSAAAGGGGGNSRAGDGRTSNLIGATLNARLASHSSSSSSAAVPSGISAPTAGVGAIPAPPSSSISRPSGSTSAQLLADLSAPAAAMASPPPAASAAAKASPANDPFAAQPPSAGKTPAAAFAATPSPKAVATAPAISGSKADNFANFANFDAATFEQPARSSASSSASFASPPPANPVGGVQAAAPAATSAVPIMPASKSGAPASSQPVAMQQQQQQPREDRYAALKDLDDIFRTSVSVQEATSTAQSTGVSLFGSSPVQAAAMPGPTPGLGGGNNTASGQRGVTPPTNNSKPFGDVFGGAAWPPAASNGATAASPSFPAMGLTSSGGGNSDWAANSGWQERNGRSPANTMPPQQQQPAVVNPFTGAANLAQLNTSPWPTTTSPVNAQQQQQQQAGNNNSNNGQWATFGALASEQAAGFQTDPFNTSSDSSKTKTTSPSGFNGASNNNENNGGSAFSADFAANFNTASPSGNQQQASNFDAFFDMAAAAATSSNGNGGSNNNPWPAAATTASAGSKNPFL